MEVRKVMKMGNSLGITIPQEMSEKLGLAVGCQVIVQDTDDITQCRCENGVCIQKLDLSKRTARKPT